MSHVIWVLQEGQDQDDWDHFFILKEEKALNRLAKRLKIKKLSEFYDHSILHEEYGAEDVQPNYVDATDVKASLQALIGALREDGSTIKSSSDVVEELEDCLAKVLEAEKGNCRIRFAIVP